MKRRAASGEHDTADGAKLGRRHVQTTQLRGAFLRIKTAAHRVAYGVWLLKDFFEHVMGVIPFSDIFGGKFNLADRMLGAIPRQRGNFELVSACGDYIEIVKINSITRIGDNCADVAGQKVFSISNSEH